MFLPRIKSITFSMGFLIGVVKIFWNKMMWSWLQNFVNMFKKTLFKEMLFTLCELHLQKKSTLQNIVLDENLFDLTTVLEYKNCHISSGTQQNDLIFSKQNKYFCNKSNKSYGFFYNTYFCYQRPTVSQAFIISNVIA